MEEENSMNESNFTGNNCVSIHEFSFDWTHFVFVRVAAGLVFASIFLVGVVGNAGVIVRVVSDRKLHSAQYIFLLNLMASDFLLCLTSVIFTPIAVIMKHWIFGGILCRAIPLCQSMSVVITSLSLTAIAVDKYAHILDSTRPPVKIGHSLVAVVVIWTLACLLNLPLVLSYGIRDGSAYQEEFGVSFCGLYCDEWSSPEYKRIYGTIVMSIQFVVPMFIIAFCYSSIMRKVKRDMMIENKQFAQSLSNVQRLEAMRRKRKIHYILILMVGAFIGSWCPLTLFNIFRDYSQLPPFVSSQPYFWALIVHSAAMSSVIWNPLLFFWLTGRKRKGSRKTSIVTDSALVTFLLALNPVRMVFKRRSRQSDSEKCAAGSNAQRTASSGGGSQFESSTGGGGGEDRNLTLNQAMTKKLSISPAPCDKFRNTAAAVFASRSENSRVKKSPSIIVNSCVQATPTVITTNASANGKKRSTPSSLECYRLLANPMAKMTNSPRAPRVMAESLSDLTLCQFEIDEANCNRGRDDKTESLSSVEEEQEIQEQVITRHKKPKGGKKSLIYLHLGASSHF